MRRFALVILIVFLFAPHAYAYQSENLIVTTNFKTSEFDEGIYNINGAVYLSLVKTCEAMGAVVFENSKSGSCYIISRDGDVIKHTAWTYFYEINGKIKYIDNISINDAFCGILVPHTMIENIFGTNIFFENSNNQLNRNFSSNFYTEIISKLMNQSIQEDFYPENFARYYTYFCYSPWLDAKTVIKSVNTGLDKKHFDDATIISNTKTTSILVNKLNFLPTNFTPENLTVVDSIYVKNTGRKYELDAEAYSRFIDMYNAAEQNGLYLKIVSAYRTESYQRSLYNSYLINNGFAHAEKYSARPGFSEHQTGLAVDINSVYASFENSKEYKWLKEHAHEYGFIERYQKGKEYITGYAYEPWHYRYVGTDAAKIIHEQNITYEEYYATYVYESPYSLNINRAQTNVLKYYHR